MPTNPIEEFLQREDDLILEAPFASIDVFQIIEAYEASARGREDETSVLASVFGDVQEQHEAAQAMKDAGTTFTGFKTPEITIDTDLIPNNPFSDCFGFNAKLPSFESCDLRTVFCSENLPKPGFLSLFDDLIAAIESFILKMSKLMDKTKFMEELCMMVDAMRFFCPQDLLLMLAALRFQIVQIIIKSLKFEVDMMALVGLLLFPMFLLSYISFDAIGSIALGPLECAFQFLDAFKDMSLGIDVAPAMGAGDYGFSKGTLIPVNQNDEAEAGDAVRSTAAQSLALAGKDTPEVLDKNIKKIDGATPKANQAANKAGNTVSDAEKKAAKATRIAADWFESNINREYAIGDLSSFDTMLSQLKGVEQKIKKLTDIWKKSCQAIIGMLTKAMTDKMNLVLQIAEVIRLIVFIEAMIRVLQNKEICTDPTVPLSPEDVIAVLEEIPDIEVGDIPDVFSVNINEAGALVVNDPVLNQTYTIPTCIGSVPDSLQTEVASWIEELEASSV